MTTGRIIEAHRTSYTVAIADRIIEATIKGFFHAEKQFPVVGDYVDIELLDDNKAVISRIQDRQSVIKRRKTHSDEEQIIVSNINLIILVMGLDGDFNLSRLERYLTLAQQSEVPAVIVLNKTDIADDVAVKIAKVQEIAAQYPILPISARTGEGLEVLTEYLTKDTTAVFLGSSGAGKSTITNWLLQEDKQKVRTVRDDDSRGRHTTTARQLFSLPHGGYIIDTPGMRELGMTEADLESETAVFERIMHYAEHCKFRDCDHERSAGCAVLTAIANGELSGRELTSYLKLQQEQSFVASKDVSASVRHHDQIMKRRGQKNEMIRRQRLNRT